MKFLEIVKMIKKKKENKNVLVLVRCGAFFVSIGKDAIWLSENLGLKTTCITNKICKIGIPVGSIYDYIDRLEQLGYSFVIYHYSKEMILESANRYAEAYRYQGKYMEYMLQIIFKMPRTEKFNIGNEFKNVMYQMLENILFINKVEMSKRLHYSNLIDAELNTQRIMIRLMYKNKWIDEKKYRVSIEMLYEIGKIVGGLVKCYAKNNSKSVR